MTFHSTLSVPPVFRELHNLIVIGTCISYEESNSNKLKEHNAKLMDGSSHVYGQET